MSSEYYQFWHVSLTKFLHEVTQLVCTSSAPAVLNDLLPGWIIDVSGVLHKDTLGSMKKVYEAGELTKGWEFILWAMIGLCSAKDLLHEHSHKTNSHAFSFLLQICGISWTLQYIFWAQKWRGKIYSLVIFWAHKWRDKIYLFVIFWVQKGRCKMYSFIIFFWAQKWRLIYFHL